MAFVIAAVAVVGGVCLVNLLLTFGVLRRLRAHGAELARLRGAGRPEDTRLVPAPTPTSWRGCSPVPVPSSSNRP